MATKKTTKKVKPVYTVDLRDIETLSDIDLVFGVAKHDAHLPLTDNELKAIIEEFGTKITFVYCDSSCKKKKLPWYKRFWNWIRRK